MCCIIYHLQCRVIYFQVVIADDLSINQLQAVLLQHCTTAITAAATAPLARLHCDCWHGFCSAAANLIHHLRFTSLHLRHISLFSRHISYIRFQPRAKPSVQLLPHSDTSNLDSFLYYAEHNSVLHLSYISHSLCTTSQSHPLSAATCDPKYLKVETINFF